MTVVYCIVAVSWVFMVNVLLITEVHYVIDVVGGLVLSIWAYRTSIRGVKYVDKAISFPFKMGKKVYEKYWKKSKGDEKDVQSLTKSELEGGKMSLSRSDSLNKNDQSVR